VEHYISQQKNQLLDSLENQVRFSQLVAVVVGDKGVGKSFLLMELQSRLEQEVLVARVDASLAMTEDQLEKTISLQLGLSWQDSEIPLEQRIKNDLTQKVLIAIDDADRLSSSCLNFILTLNQNQLEFRESVIFILLAGDNSLPALIKKTNTYSLHQDMCVVFQVEPIEQNETQALISEMDPDPKLSSQALYSQKKLDYFWQLSKGNPAELNYHVSRWLAEQSPSEPNDVLTDESASYSKSFLYLLVATVLMSVLIFQNEINHLISSSGASEKSKEIKMNEETETALRPATDTTSAKAQTTNSLEGKQKVFIDSSEQNEKDSEEITNTNSEPRVSESVASQSKQETMSSVDAKDDSGLADRLSPNKTATDLTTDESASDINKTEDAATSYLTEDEQELLLLADNQYLFQWLALSGMKAAEEYVAQHELRDEMKIYRRAQSGSVLFLIVSGDYTSRTDALAAQEVVKSTKTVEKPWIKSIKAVKNEIKAFQKANK